MDPMRHSKKTLVKGTFGDCGGNGRIRSYMNVRKKKTQKQRNKETKKQRNKERKKKERKKEKRALVPPNL